VSVIGVKSPVFGDIHVLILLKKYQLLFNA